MNPEAAQFADLITKLERRFGPLRATETKPFSLHYRTSPDTVLIKIYRTISPDARQARECEALRVAPSLGIRVPHVLACGRHRDITWAAIEVLPGRALPLVHQHDVHSFVHATRSVLDKLHGETLDHGAGPGWSGKANAASEFLANQLSGCVRELPAWSTLHEQLRLLDDAPIVRLHGDIKPDHLLVADGCLPAVVDWEACARGPATIDEADIAFRVVRGLTYANVPEDVTEDAARLLSPHSVALAWRLALWVDRRHDLSGESAVLLSRIVEVSTADSATAAAVRAVRLAKAMGTPF